ncbi:hypothetical protein [Nonomuraea sp. NPDC048826]|uniref:hypothetical protein n=1 Tax=Nonomuraea sp. NPDC048826 TaxID=3364347 RepID=UPI003716C78F
MSAMHDYYRAPDRATATWRPDRLRAPAEPLPGAPVFDVVDTKWIDPQVAIGELVALIGKVPYSDELVKTVVLYPPPDGAPTTDVEVEALPRDSPYLVGPQIEELPVRVRDVLAGFDDARLPDVARRWLTEDPSDNPYERETRELVEGLVALARRAKESGQLLYCWSIAG